MVKAKNRAEIQDAAFAFKLKEVKLDCEFEILSLQLEVMAEAKKRLLESKIDYSELFSLYRKNLDHFVENRLRDLGDYLKTKIEIIREMDNKSENNKQELNTNKDYHEEFRSKMEKFLLKQQRQVSLPYISEKSSIVDIEKLEEDLKSKSDKIRKQIEKKQKELLDIVMPPDLKEVDIPPFFICPITKLIMADPVLTADGGVFEREAIEEWFKKNGYISYSIPHHKLNDKKLIPVNAIKQQINEFIATYDVNKKRIYLPEGWKREMVNCIKKKDKRGVENCYLKDRRLLTEPLEDFKTALHFACENSSIEIVSWLVEQLHTGSGNYRNVKKLVTTATAGISPLYLAAYYNDSHKDTSSVNTPKDEKAGDRKVLSYLLEKLRIEPEDIQPLKDVQLVKSNKYNGQTINECLLHEAETNKGHIKTLLKMGAKIDTKDNRSSSFLKDDSTGNTALHLAAQSGYVANIVILLDNSDINIINIKNNSGDTSLHWAILYDQKPAVKVLLEKGADVTAKNNKGNTPLHLAVLYGNKNIIRLLLQSPFIFLDDKNNEGKAPLHLVVEADPRSSSNKIKTMDRWEIMNLLLEKGANGSIRTTSEGDTILHLAAKEEAYDIFHIAALRHRIDPSIKNYKNQEARALIKDQKLYEETYEMLRISYFSTQLADDKKVEKTYEDRIKALEIQVHDLVQLVMRINLELSSFRKQGQVLPRTASQSDSNNEPQQAETESLLWKRKPAAQLPNDATSFQNIRQQQQLTEPEELALAMELSAQSPEYENKSQQGREDDEDKGSDDRIAEQTKLGHR